VFGVKGDELGPLRAVFASSSIRRPDGDHCPAASDGRLTEGMPIRGGLAGQESHAPDFDVSSAMRLDMAGLLVSVAVASGCSSDRSPTSVTVPRDSVASYTVTFTSTWSASTHPVDFPTSAHFSGLIGATHSNRVVFWRTGELASPGIQAMAELGS